MAIPPNFFLPKLFSASLFSLLSILVSGTLRLLLQLSSLPVLRWGGTGSIGPILNSFFSRDPSGSSWRPPSSWSTGWRLAGAKLHRLFTNTLWPAGVSKGLGLEAACFRALPIFVFSNKCIESFPFQCQSDKASSFFCSRKAMKCAKPVESNICYLRKGLPFW